MPYKHADKYRTRIKQAFYAVICNVAPLGSLACAYAAAWKIRGECSDTAKEYKSRKGWKNVNEIVWQGICTRKQIGCRKTDQRTFVCKQTKAACIGKQTKAEHIKTKRIFQLGGKAGYKGGKGWVAVKGRGEVGGKRAWKQLLEKGKDKNAKHESEYTKQQKKQSVSRFLLPNHL